jgi:hypothetical protein
MYVSDIAVLDGHVRVLKLAGVTKMSRSKLLRIAVQQLDLTKVMRDLTKET